MCACIEVSYLTRAIQPSTLNHYTVHTLILCLQTNHDDLAAPTRVIIPRIKILSRNLRQSDLLKAKLVARPKLPVPSRRKPRMRERMTLLSVAFVGCREILKEGR